MFKRSFSSKKFFSILLVATFSMVVEYVMLLSDNVIAGNMLGEDALAAITIVQPFFSVAIFFAMLVSMGTAVLVSYEVGRQNRARANQYFSQGVILAALFGVGLTAAFQLLRGQLFAWMDVPPEIAVYAEQYFQYMSWLPVFQVFSTLLYSVVIAEGGEKLCAISTAVQVGGNIGLSILLCKLIGMGGVALGTVIATGVTCGVMSLHFLTKHNQLKFRWFWEGKSVLRVFKFSASEALVYLYIAVAELFFNSFLLARFGADAIIVFAVVMNLQALLITGFDGIGEAIQPLVSIYRGEKNWIGIKKTMDTALMTTLVEGLAVTAAVMIVAPLIPGAFGITDPALAAQAALALRVYAPAAVCFSFLLAMASYYVYMEHIRLANVLSALLLLVCPIGCGALLSYPLGLGGVWVGFTLSAALALCVSMLAAWRDSKKDGGTFPLLLDKEGLARQYSDDAESTPRAVMELMARAEAEMERRGVEKKRMLRVLLMIEETCMLAIARGGGKRFYLECTLMFGDGITLILRDGGEYSDATEDVMPASAQEYTAGRIVAAHGRVNFALASGNNRTIFHF